MNREIKFRAYDLDEKMMVKVGAIDWVDGKIISLNYPKGKLYPDERFGDHVAIMEYTNHKDDVNTEVYEGDIIKVTNLNYPHENCVTDVVYGTDGQWSARAINPDGEYKYEHGLPLSWWDSMRVIGNIYENPELLK